MANTDQPRGFEPVRTLDGSPFVGRIQGYTVAGSTTLAVGDAAGLNASGLATKAASGDSILGVVVGVGDTSAIEFGGDDSFFNPDGLTRTYATDGQTVAVCLANNVVFTGQTDADLDLDIGDPADILPGTFTPGTHNRSQSEVDANVNGDIRVVEYPTYNNANGATGLPNDPTLANAQVNFIFNSLVFGQGL